MRRHRAFVILTGVALAGGALALSWGVPLLPGGHFASLNGVRLYYEVRGHGRALLLLHGGGGDCHQLPRQVEALSQHFTVIAPDSRGHGRSTDGSGPLHYHQMAEDMVALLNHLHVHGADIVGWSDGGIIGLDLAIHHPVRVGRVATFGANYRPEGVIGYPSDCAQTGDSLRVPSGLGPSDILARKLQFLWCTEPQFTTAELASIHVPVLVVVGDHDAVLPEHSAALARTIPNGRLYVIPDASHAVLLEKPDLCNQLLLEFLGSPGRRK